MNFKTFKQRQKPFYHKQKHFWQDFPKKKFINFGDSKKSYIFVVRKNDFTQKQHKITEKDDKSRDCKRDCEEDWN